MIILHANALFTFLMDSFKFSTVECQSVGKSGCRFRQPSGLVVYFADWLIGGRSVGHFGCNSALMDYMAGVACAFTP